MAIQSAAEKQIIELERQFWQAIKDRDVAAAKRLTDFPCILAGPQGVSRLDEEAFTKMMNDPHCTLNDFNFEPDVEVRLLGDEVAIVGYKAHEKLTVEGEPIELDVAESSTWVRRDGRWACAQHTEAIVGDPFGRDRKIAERDGGRTTKAA